MAAPVFGCVQDSDGELSEDSMGFWQRIRAVVRREQVQQEIADEFQFHLDMKTTGLMQSGLSAHEARTRSAIHFGASLRLREAGFDVRGGGLLDEIFNDLRFARRVLARHPTQTAVIALTIALGIGVNTAVFSVVNSLLLQPLPFAGADRLVDLHQAEHGQMGGVSYPNFLDWRAASRAFEGMAVYASTSAALISKEDAVRISGATVSAGLFPLLGVVPIRGRLFRPDEDRLGERIVIISDRLWRTRFQQRPDILAQRMILDGVPYLVIGVIPSGQAFPVQNDQPEFWTTVAVDADPKIYGGTIPTSRGYPRYDAAIARLKPGVSLAQAQSELDLIARNIAREHPKAASQPEIRIVPAIDDITGNTRPLLSILCVAVLCVLLVACANVATLLLVSALERGKEFALRAAIGASSTRLFRQVLMESTLLAATGGAAGVFLAWALVQLFVVVAPASTPRLDGIRLDRTVLLFALVLSVISGMLFGLAPALTATRQDLHRGLKKMRRNHLLRPGTLLIAGQLAGSMLLTCAAAVLAASFYKIAHAPRGFDPHDVLTAQLSLPVSSYPQKSDKPLQFYTALLENLRRTQGIESASIAQSLPLSGDNNSTTVEIVGDPQRAKPGVDLRFVATGYFETLRIPLLSGRLFSDRDTASAPACVVVNQAFVNRFLSGRNPEATSLLMGWGGSAPKRIVGVAGNVRHTATDPSIHPEVYVPYGQFPINSMAVLIRTAGDPRAYAATVRQQVRALDPSIPVDRLRTLEEYRTLSAGLSRFLMWVLILFAASGVLLAAIGLYGLLAYSTECRTHEFGIRLALGSRAPALMRLVLTEGIALGASGIAAGLILCRFSSTLLRRWLYDLSPTDPLSLTAAAVALLLACLLAAWLPARRATRVDPLISLRTE